MPLYRVEVIRTGNRVFYVSGETEEDAMMDVEALSASFDDSMINWWDDDYRMDLASNPRPTDEVWTGGPEGDFVAAEDWGGYECA